jgi:hypothetical protein
MKRPTGGHPVGHILWEYIYMYIYTIPHHQIYHKGKSHRRNGPISRIFPPIWPAGAWRGAWKIGWDRSTAPRVGFLVNLVIPYTRDKVDKEFGNVPISLNRTWPFPWPFPWPFLLGSHPGGRGLPNGKIIRGGLPPVQTSPGKI